MHAARTGARFPPGPARWRAGRTLIDTTPAHNTPICVQHRSHTVIDIHLWITSNLALRKTMQITSSCEGLAGSAAAQSFQHLFDNFEIFREILKPSPSENFQIKHKLKDNAVLKFFIEYKYLVLYLPYFVVTENSRRSTWPRPCTQ